MAQATIAASIENVIREYVRILREIISDSVNHPSLIIILAAKIDIGGWKKVSTGYLIQ